jgi:hypothetical protein
MFLDGGNAMVLENILLRRGVDALQGRLPPGWSARLASTPGQATGGVVRVTAPDGRATELRAEVKRRLDPRGALELVEQLRATAPAGPALAISSWMSPATRARLVDAGVNVLDLTENIHVVLSDPGLFIDVTGADQDPSPEERRATLKGAKAARVVRSLCRVRVPVGVRELAAIAGTTPGYVSKLITMLDREAALTRTGDGKVSSVQLPRLLERWAEDAPLSSRAMTSSWIDPRGLDALLKRLAGAGQRYAVTGSLAAGRRAPVAAPRLASVYVEDPDLFAKAVGLRPAEAGANVLLLVPKDEAVLGEVWEDGGVLYAALPQVAADLLSGPGRGPAEAEALIAWMGSNEEVGRG